MMSTGDNFHVIVMAIARTYQIDFQCVENPSYLDYANNGYETIGCGNYGAAMAIFSSFVVIVMMIFLNLFIAIIVQGYEDTTERNKNKIFNPYTRKHFKAIWSYYD